MTIKTLLVVEPSVQMRRLIRVLLGTRIEQIIECADGSEALAAYANCRPDWVLMDINIKSVDPSPTTSSGAKAGDAISITRRINQLFPDAYVTMLADYDDQDVREAAFLAGAAEYVLKDNLSSLPALLSARVAGRRAPKAD
jgi:CheY-like chemotaxis protein